MNTASELRRLLDLIPYLRQNQGLTLGELAIALSCTESEVEALLQRILLCGVPPYTPCDYVSVYWDEGKVWIEYADHFRRPVAFSSQELACLQLVLDDSLFDSDDTSRVVRQQLKEKLARHCAPDNAKAVALGATGLPIHVAQPGTWVRNWIGQLKTAIRKQTRVHLRHFSTTQFALCDREVSPYYLDRVGENIYLVGFDHTRRNEIVRFRLDRIAELRQLETPAAPPDKKTLQDVMQRGPKPGYRGKNMVAQFAPHLASALRDAFGSRAVSVLSNGRVQLKVPLANDAWLLRYVLSFGEDAEIITPENLRDKMRELLDTMLKQGGPA